MHNLDTTHLNYGGLETVAQNENHPTRQPRVVGTADADGPTVEFRAVPGYGDGRPLEEVVR